MFDFIKNISPVELVIVLVILLLLFGTKIMTNLGRATGETVKEIKKVKKSFGDALEDNQEKKPSSA